MITTQPLLLLMTLPDKRHIANDEVLRAAERRLNDSAYLELRRIQCGLQADVLTLKGRVSSHYLRQVAQATVLGLAGTKAIDNQLQVLPRVLPDDGENED